MFFTDGYPSSLSASTIAGNRTSFTTISVCSATAQWYVTCYAGSHHNHQGCITISNLFPFLLLTLRHRWSVYVATPFHPHLTYSIHRNSLDNHGTSQPLRWCRQSEPFIFIEPGSANNNFLRLAAFAQRTRKARLLLTCGAIHLVPPPASCGEERHIPGLTGYLAVSVQVVRLPGAQFWSDGLILRRFTLRQT